MMKIWFRKSAIALGLILSLVFSQIAQAQFVVNELTGFNSGNPESAAYDVTFLGTIQWSSGSTITGSIDIGAKHSKKEVFLVCAIISSSATLTAASTTVGGTAVTKATTETALSNGTRSLGFVSLPTMSGSQTITATFSSALTQGKCDIYQVRNRPNRGNNQTAQNNATCSGVTSCAAGSVSLVANNITFGAHYHANNNATTTPSGTTAGADTTGGSRQFQTCYRQPVGGSSSPNDTWSWSGSVNSGVNVWVFN